MIREKPTTKYMGSLMTNRKKKKKAAYTGSFFFRQKYMAFYGKVNLVR